MDSISQNNAQKEILEFSIQLPESNQYLKQSWNWPFSDFFIESFMAKDDSKNGQLAGFNMVADPIKPNEFTTSRFMHNSLYDLARPNL